MKLNWMSLLFALNAVAIAWYAPLLTAAPAQQAYVKASNTGAEDLFGWGVAISGDTVVIGAAAEDSSATGVNGNQSDNSAASSGAAYVFVRSGTNWSQQAYLKASNTGGSDRFGASVAISGDTLVVGADGEDSNAIGVNGNQSNNSASGSGAAYIFVRSGTNWSQQAYLKASNTEAQDHFGLSVAISGDIAVVAARDEDSSATGVNGDQSNNSAIESGAAYVFVRSGTNWSQEAYLKGSNNEATLPLGPFGDAFACSVTIAGDTLVVGAVWEDSDATGVNGNQNNNRAADSGAAYVFVRDGTNWTQQAYLKASNTRTLDHFGGSVAVFGDTVIVGSAGEDSIAGDSGAAYAFVRQGTNWSQQAYLKASNPELTDSFGIQVALSTDTAAIGAEREDSGATGVNGNQSDNSAHTAGAAYVFTGLGIGPSLTVTSEGSSGYFLRFNGTRNVSYRLQRAANVTGPWDTIATLTAPASGQIDHHDTTPLPGQAFYRTVQP